MSAGAGGTAMLWCRRCEADHPADHYFCPRHPGEELVDRPADTTPATPGDADGADGGTERPRSVCWKCGEASPNATNRHCARCHESLVPPALVVEFPDGWVVVQDRGQSAELGRAGEYGHVFARYPNVSRWHATVGVDAQGSAWITPHPAAPNGTFVNGDEIFDRTPVRPGDLIRLATDRGPRVGPASERIRQPCQEPSDQP